MFCAALPHLARQYTGFNFDLASGDFAVLSVKRAGVQFYPGVEECLLDDAQKIVKAKGKLEKVVAQHRAIEVILVITGETCRNLLAFDEEVSPIVACYRLSTMIDEWL